MVCKQKAEGLELLPANFSRTVYRAILARGVLHDQAHIRQIPGVGVGGEFKSAMSRRIPEMERKAFQGCCLADVSRRFVLGHVPFEPVPTVKFLKPEFTEDSVEQLAKM